MFRTQRVHLQEESCICSYGIVCFICIVISILIDAYTTVFLKMNPLGSKHVEDIKIKILNINLENVHFVGLYCINL